jgi:hypothetical protein
VAVHWAGALALRHCLAKCRCPQSRTGHAHQRLDGETCRFYGLDELLAGLVMEQLLRQRKRLQMEGINAILKEEMTKKYAQKC